MMRTALWVSLGVVLAACGNENTLTPDGETGDPALEIESPAAASFERAGTVEVTGIANALDGVTVNGVVADRGIGTFAASIDLARGVNLIEAEGLDPLGNTLFTRHGVLAGTYGNAAITVPKALDVRVNENGLQTILDTASTMLSPETLEPMLASANPVYDTNLSIEDFEVASLRVDINEVTFNDLSLYAVPGDGELFISVWIPDLYVQVSATGSLSPGGFDIVSYTTGAEVWAQRIELEGYATISVVNGQLQVGWSRSTLDVAGLGFDFELLPDAIESALLLDPIMDFVEPLIAGRIDAMIPALLEERLSSLDIAYETELMGKRLTIEADFASASVDRQGVALGMDMNVNMPGSTSGAPGYLLAGDGVPTLDRYTDLSMAVSDNLMNRVLFEAWGASLLEMRLSTNDESLSPAMLAPLGADTGTIRVDAKLPPVIVEKDDALQLQIGELIVVVETPGGDMGSRLEASVAVFATVDLEVRNGTLRMAIGSPELVMQVLSSDWGATNETTTTLLENMLPIESLLGLLGGIQIPLPALAGLSVDAADAERDSSGVHTGIDISLR